MSSIFVFLLLSASVLFGSTPAETLPSVKKGLRVSVSKISRQTFIEEVQGFGRVVITTEAFISAEIQAPVKEIFVQAGDWVQENQVLASLETDLLQSSLNKALAELKEARSALTRLEGLIRQGGASKEQLEQKSTALEVQEAVVDEIRLKLKKCLLISPVAGRILERQIYLNQVASPDKPLFRIAPVDSKEVELEILEQHFQSLSPGMEVELFTSVKKIGKGQVTQVIPLVNPLTHSFKIRVKPQTENLLTGQYVEALIKIHESEAMALPKTAFVYLDGQSGVYLVSDKATAKFCKALTGRAKAGFVEVISTCVQETDLVVTRAGSFLAPNDLLEVEHP